MKFKVTAAPFIVGSFIGGFLCGGNYEFAFSSVIIFSVLVLTKQVKLL